MIIRRLLNMPIYGNASLDTEMLALAADIIMSKTTNMSQKRTALRRINLAVNGDEPAVTEKDVLEYQREFRELLE